MEWKQTNHQLIFWERLKRQPMFHIILDVQIQMQDLKIEVILRERLKRMHDNQENIFYYITVMNENYKHPKIPEDSKKGIK